MLPRFQQRSESARSAHTGATAAPTPRTARPLRRRLGPATRRPGPASGPRGPCPPSRRRRRRPAPARQSRLPGNRGAAGRRVSRLPGGARAATPPTLPQGDPPGVPAAQGRAGRRRPLRAGGPASQPRWGRRGGDAVTCRGLGRSCRRRSPGNRGSDTEVGSQTA